MAVTPRTQPALNVSLEDHLADTLRPLRTLLPEPLAAELTQILDNAPPTSSPRAPPPHSPPRTIPYDLLAAISKWSRSPAGHSALASHDPPLPVQDYVLLALLAGTRTSPERKFPLLQTHSQDGEASRRRELEDRRAVTAVFNALLSILGSGLATWWAAGRLAWKDEWKVLLALSAAIIVACSEGILYLIWEDRRARRTRSRRPLRFIRSTRETDKKQDLDVLHASSQDSSRSQNLDPAVVSVTSAHVPGTSDGVLRERTVATADEPARQNQ